MSILTTLQLPLPWEEFDLPSPLQTRSTVLVDGPPAWAWRDAAPSFPIAHCTAATGGAAPGWDLDHVVLMVPDVEEAITAMAAIGVSPRLRMAVKGRSTAFFRVGPVLEVIESPV